MHYLLTFACFLLAAIMPELRKPSDPFVSGDGFRSCARFILDEETTFLPEKVNAGGVVFVQIGMIELFFGEFHPLIANPYILITHNGDESAPGLFRSFLDDPKLIAWFTLNMDGPPHPKLHPIPIGIANRWHGSGNISFIQKAIDQHFPREHLLYFNFTIQNCYEERWPLYQLFNRAPYCYRPIKKRFDRYLEDLAASKFVFSPRGVGLDTYRLWESLYLGSYPIVRSSALDPLYEGLPVVVVDQWTDVTESFLTQKYEEMSKNTYQLEKLQMEYWRKEIASVKSEFLRGSGRKGHHGKGGRKGGQVLAVDMEIGDREALALKKGDGDSPAGLVLLP